MAVGMCSHLGPEDHQNSPTDHLPVLMIPADQYGHVYNFRYMSEEKKKVLGTFLTQPCGSTGTLVMTRATDMALLQ